MEVRDEGADSEPAVRDPGGMTEDGRGLEIVHLIADRWGQRGGRSGRTVFFELRWPPPAASPSTVAGGPAQQASRSARWTTMLNGTRLRQLRHEHGLSQESLADRAGLSLTTVARLEQQPVGPCRGRTLARLAAALGEQPAALGV